MSSESGIENEQGYKNCTATLSDILWFYGCVSIGAFSWGVIFYLLIWS